MYGKEYRPVLKLPKTTTERIWNVVGILLFTASIIYIIVSFGSLPDKIPAHFNGAGEVDRYGSKFELLVLPSIGLILWVFLEIVERKPHIHNYPSRLNETNVEAFYMISRKMLNVIKNLCLLLFAYISFETVQIGLGEAESISNWLLPIIIVGMFVPMVYGILQQRKIK